MLVAARTRLSRGTGIWLMQEVTRMARDKIAVHVTHAHTWNQSAQGIAKRWAGWGEPAIARWLTSGLGRQEIRAVAGHTIYRRLRCIARLRCLRIDLATCQAQQCDEVLAPVPQHQFRSGATSALSRSSE